MAKEILAGLAAAEVDKLFETKGKFHKLFDPHVWGKSDWMLTGL